jgi:hypothetical protein
MRLIVAVKEGFGFGYIGPFSEPFAPPGIVLGNGMKLSQKESY